MTTYEEAEDRRVLSVPGLTVAFQWRRERWVHEVLVDGAALACSLDVEADKQDHARVVSPTYQEAHHDETESGPRLLLVGKAGPHHFSAVVTLTEEDGRATLAFDIADRCRAPLAGLAATYVLDRTSSDLRDADAARIAWDVGGQLRLEAKPGASLALGEAGRRGTRVQVHADIEDQEATRRLAYRWVLVP